LDYESNYSSNKIKEVGSLFANRRSFYLIFVALSAVFITEIYFFARARFYKEEPKVVHVARTVTIPYVIDNSRLLVSTIKQNDSLIRIAKRLGISNDNSKEVKTILALKAAKPLQELSPGKKIKLTVDKTSLKLKQLVYAINELDTLIISSSDNAWHAQVKHIDPVVNFKYVSAIINGSVYTAAKNKGISNKLVTKLASIFNRKVNFNKMRKGERFAVLYKEYTIDGKKIKEDEIVAAELMHKDKLHRMIGFTDPKGNTDYYTPEGYNAKPPISRLPITNYRRISSPFNTITGRFHPILGYRRPHLGVDFSASFGTPVKATCNGKIKFVGYHGGHGRTIMIARGTYKALYAHLSRFSSKIHEGSYVKQGQVIGFVGSSGLSSGPHLHFEVITNGVHHDPMKIKLPEGEMIAFEYRKRFLALSKQLQMQLDLHGGNERKMLAMNQNADVNAALLKKLIWN
jgi:murein DD-endopeptidase MepM/ murein hydrolase activator NlpD